MQQMQLRTNSSMGNNSNVETGADATAIGHSSAASVTNADSSPGTIKKETTLFVKIEVLHSFLNGCAMQQRAYPMMMMH